MSKKSQKDAVVEEVLLQIPSFNKGQDNALDILSSSQLEVIKSNVANLISNGSVEYGKDATNAAEVRSYSRSMVMNHLKKAKELNGGNQYKSSSPKREKTTTSSTTVTKSKLPKSINASLTPQDLQEHILNNLV